MGFMEVVIRAFDGHYPLIIRPDDLWLVLANGFASHVEENAETLRHNFVSHEGKKVLVVNADHLVMGQTKPEDWERDIFPSFSTQIRQNTIDKVHSVIATPFSTSTATDIAAHEITLMAAMKKYFDYSVCTMCGIPWIELQGTLEDWQSLYQRAEQMCGLMLPETGKDWFAVLGPVLKEFINAYSGKVNLSFWESICKRVLHGQGSGSYETINGWVTLLYLKLAKYHQPWMLMTSDSGPEPDTFPNIVSTTPVSWTYYGQLYELHFHAGFFGIYQDIETLALQSVIGWAVTHDPPQSRGKRLIELKQLLSEINKGNDNNSKWRINQIEKEIQGLSNAK